MKESERELLDSLRPGNSEEPPESTGSSSSNADVDMNPNEEEEEDEDEASLPESIITPFNPPPTSHPTFANISNLTALRLFNDLDVRLAMPPPPELEKSRYDPKNVLINLNGWQEIYEGKNIWIYDPRSIQDDCVRVVEQAGCVYGAATCVYYFHKTFPWLTLSSEATAGEPGSHTYPNFSSTWLSSG